MEENRILRNPLVHRLFGSLYGVWIGFIFGGKFPQIELEVALEPKNIFNTFFVFCFIIFVIFLIAMFAVILYYSFTKDTIIKRIFMYLISTVAAIFVASAIFMLGTSKYVGIADDLSFFWELLFLAFVVPGWTATAEAIEYRQL